MKKIYLFIFSLLAGLNISAQFVNDTTSNTRIADWSGSEQATPLSATTSSGLTYITWFDNFSSNYELRMQLLDSDGNKLWPDSGLLISNYPQSTALFRYDLKTDNEDNAIVAFQDIRSGDLRIVAYKLDIAGNFVWSNTGIELTDSTATGLSPTIGITASNNVIIAWNANLNTYNWVSFQKISGTGTVLWSKRIFDQTNNYNYSRARMVPNGSDDFLMMYVEELGGFPGVTSTLFAQHFDVNGDQVWMNAVQVSTNTIPFFIFPDIISDEHGGFFTAFNSSNPINPGLNDVFAQRVDSAGNTWSSGGTQVANSSTEHKSTGGFCYNTSNGGLCITLQVLDGSQGSSGVYIQSIDNNGNVLFGSNGIQLKNIDPIYYNPHAIVDAGDGLICIFSYGGFGNQVLSSIKTDYAGNHSWSYEPMISTYLSNKDDLSAGFFENSQTIVVWQDDRIDGGVYTQNLRGDGSFGVITGINQLQSASQLFLYPSPSASAKLIYNSAGNENISLSLINLEGKEVFFEDLDVRKGLNNIVLPNEILKRGIYIINVFTSSGMQQIKWVKL
ncbi:MAG TPA: T9SS type A sorting domain-containing protein [Bacteroidia bacterium]|nr:T9SS type A sorting domain-containing protein [Bacteroidia bacterium]